MIGMGGVTGVTKSMEAGPPLFIYADSPAIAPHPGDTCPGTPALWPNTRQVHESAPSFVLSLSPCQKYGTYTGREHRCCGPPPSPFTEDRMLEFKRRPSTYVFFLQQCSH